MGKLRPAPGRPGDPGRSPRRRAPRDQSPGRVARRRRVSGRTARGRCPTAPVEVDSALAAEVLALGPPFVVDRDAHRGEHSLEVQLPLLVEAAPGARIVPLAVSAGTGRPAIEAGARLGRLLAARRSAGDRVVLAISSDMAHYPPADACARATETLLPAILDLDPGGLAAVEADMRLARIPGLGLRHVRDRARRARPRGAAGDGRRPGYRPRRHDVRGCRWTAGPDGGLPGRPFRRPAQIVGAWPTTPHSLSAPACCRYYPPPRPSAMLPPQHSLEGSHPCDTRLGGRRGLPS